MLSDAERRFLSARRVAHLATADPEARPAVVPVCFAMEGDRVVTPIDEKPKAVSPRELRRVRDVEANPRVALVADRYAEEWSALAWVQLRGTADVVDSDPAAVAALEGKYPQYADHDLAARPLLVVDPGHVVSWGL